MLMLLAPISCCSLSVLFCFFFNDTSTTEIYTYLHTLSLHDALPILSRAKRRRWRGAWGMNRAWPSCPIRPSAIHRVAGSTAFAARSRRSEEHTSELQSLMRISYAVFCLKKKKRYTELTK